MASKRAKRQAEEKRRREERRQRTCNRLRFFDPETTDIRQAPCQLWGCPWCGPKLKAELRARIIVGSKVAIRLGCGLIEVVLTLDPKKEGYAADEWNLTVEQARYVSGCQRGLLKRWGQRRKRAGLPTTEYVWVNEWQERGACHRHLLLAAEDFHDMSRAALGKLRKELRAMIPEAGFGQVCDIDPVRDPTGFGGYLAKYVTKAVEAGPLSCIHRYGASKRFMPTRVAWKAARIASMGFTSTEKIRKVIGGYRWWCNPEVLEFLAQMVECRQSTGLTAEEVRHWKFLECGKPSVRPWEEALSYDTQPPPAA